MKNSQPKGSIALPLVALAAFLVLFTHGTGIALQAPAGPPVVAGRVSSPGAGLRVVLDSKGKAASPKGIMTGLGQRIRDVRTGPDGFVYVLTDETSGAMLRLEPGM
jgi:hypothetical protein